MKAQQIGMNYYLFFSRVGERLNGVKDSRLTSGGELDLGNPNDRSFESNLLDENNNALGKKVYVNLRPTLPYWGLLIHEEGRVQIRLGQKLLDELVIQDTSSFSIKNSEGIVRVIYRA